MRWQLWPACDSCTLFGKKKEKRTKGGVENRCPTPAVGSISISINLFLLWLVPLLIISHNSSATLKSERERVDSTRYALGGKGRDRACCQLVSQSIFSPWREYEWR